jgi:hypothetical protein
MAAAAAAPALREQKISTSTRIRESGRLVLEHCHNRSKQRVLTVLTPGEKKTRRLRLQDDQTRVQHTPMTA